MSTQAFAKGDKIRWTLSGEVTGIVPFDDRVELRVTDDSGNTYYVVPNSGNVEKVEPEYEVFGPGDVVERRHGPRGRRHLTESGYVFEGRHIEWRDAIIPKHEFTSAVWQRVEIG